MSGTHFSRHVIVIHPIIKLVHTNASTLQSWRINNGELTDNYFPFCKEQIVWAAESSGPAYRGQAHGSGFKILERKTPRRLPSDHLLLPLLLQALIVVAVLSPESFRREQPSAPIWLQGHIQTCGVA